MTPEERAENVVDCFKVYLEPKDIDDYCRTIVAKEIRAAMEEALNEYQELRCCNAVRTRNEALEEAAKIADNLQWKDHGDDNCLDIASTIRALKTL